ncbi:MAG: glycosyltransferase [Nitrospirae bacterium]|nr:glycosyltransferase [Nitrospirota bacterium]
MIFKKNIKVLELQDPLLAEALVRTTVPDDVKVVDSRTGAPTLRVGNIILHSIYDPVSEAEAWVQYNREKFDSVPAVVVFGFGLGYHIRDMSASGGKEIIVFEPRKDILRAAMEHIDLTALLPKIKIVSGPDVPRINNSFEILDHKPSTGLSPEYFKWLRARLMVLRKMKKGLRIMVVGPIYGGSLSIAGYCAKALKNLGHTVDFLDNSFYKKAFLGIDKITSNQMHQDELRKMFIDFTSEAVIARCADYRPDLLLALAQAPLSGSSLMKLRENRIPAAFWFVEDFRFRAYWKEVAPFYDYFFTIQKGPFFNQLKDAGVKNAAYIPLAASASAHRIMELLPGELEKYGSDISFIGAGYYNRRSFLTGLIDFDMKIWGSEWDMNSPLSRCIQRSGAWVETADIVKIFNASKININLHSSAYHDGIDPYGDFVNPRTFEIAACGGFQLVDRRSELSDMFRVGEEIICFENLSDIRKKIRYFLDHPDERAEIALRSRERVLKEHTYERRMEAMLRFIFDSGYEPPVWNTEIEDVEHMIETAGRQSELGEYLCRYIDKGKICIDDIIGKIDAGKEPLSYVEKIFLLMHEMKKVYLKR